MKFFLKKYGFSFVELLVVIAIISIIVAIIVPAYNSIVTRSKVARALAELRSGGFVQQSSSHFEFRKDPWGNYYSTVDGFTPKDAYSFGPDGIDDKRKILYDPSNGIISPGDVFLP